MPFNKQTKIAVMLVIAGIIGLFLTGTEKDKQQIVKHHFTYQAKDYTKEYQQEYCLAQNIYYEARGSTLADRAAVADVTLNRVQTSGFPDTICGVVKQAKIDIHGKPIKNKCQFSWYCDGKQKEIKDQEAWIEAKKLAWNIIHNNEHRGITGGATHYHTAKIKPYWRKSFTKVAQIGAHIYYKQKA